MVGSEILENAISSPFLFPVMLLLAIAKALDSKICVMNDKKKVLDCLEDPDLKSRVTLDWSAGRVHVLPMGKLTQQVTLTVHSSYIDM